MEAIKQLSKKEKKALAFRNGKGKKKEEIQPDLPDLEDLDALESQATLSVDTEAPSKKRKREKEIIPVEGIETEKVAEKVEGVIEVEGERKKKRQRGKSKGTQKAIALAEGKARLVLFVGQFGTGSYCLTVY